MTRGMCARRGEYLEAGPVTRIGIRAGQIRAQGFTGLFEFLGGPSVCMSRHDGGRCLTQCAGMDRDTERLHAPDIIETQVDSHPAPAHRRATLCRALGIFERVQRGRRGGEPQYIQAV